MCRWFVYIGEESSLLEDILIKPKHSIVKQIVHHFLPNLHVKYDPKSGQQMSVSGCASDEDGPNRFSNIDGFGIGYYTGTAAEFNFDNIDTPCVYKNILPPLNDRNLASLCSHTASKCVFAHIRAGMSPIVETNNHPFVFGRYLFMHNGDVNDFSKIKINLLRKLSTKAYQNIFGTTDTEHVAALFFTYLGDDWTTEISIEKLKATMIETIKEILSLTNENAQNDGGPVCASSLNFAVTDNCKVLTTRFSTVEDCEPPSLYYSTTVGPILNRKYPNGSNGNVVEMLAKSLVNEHGKHVIIASEPNTYHEQDWHLIPSNSFALIDKDFSVTIEKIIL